MTAMRRLIQKAAAAGLAIGFVLAPATSQAAPSGLTIEATKAQVNRAGQVTVLGASACAAGVRAHYGADVPDNLSILTNMGWTATQGAVSTVGLVDGANDRAAACYNRYPRLPGQPRVCGEVTNPCPWKTSYFSDTAFYGSGFTNGKVHVDLTSGNGPDGPEGYILIAGVPQFDAEGHLQVIGLSGTGSSDVQAVPVR